MCTFGLKMNNEVRKLKSVKVVHFSKHFHKKSGNLAENG